MITKISPVMPRPISVQSHRSVVDGAATSTFFVVRSSISQSVIGRNAAAAITALTNTPW